MESFHWVRRSTIVTAVFVLTGCVTINVPRVSPGSYPNFREMAVAQMELVPWGNNVPRDLIRRFNVCGVDVMLRYYTPNELERLDKYARGEVHISDSELKALEREIEDRMGGEKALREGMEKQCPDVLKDAEAYKKSHS